MLPNPQWPEVCIMQQKYNKIPLIFANCSRKPLQGRAFQTRPSENGRRAQSAYYDLQKRLRFDPHTVFKKEERWGDARRREEGWGDTRRNEETRGYTKRHEERWGDTRRNEETGADTMRHEERWGDARRREETRGEMRRREETREEMRRCETQGEMRRRKEMWGEARRTRWRVLFPRLWALLHPNPPVRTDVLQWRRRKAVTKGRNESLLIL